MKSSHYELEFPISKISDSEEFQGRTEYDDEWIDTLSEQIAKRWSRGTYNFMA